MHVHVVLSIFFNNFKLVMDDFSYMQFSVFLSLILGTTHLPLVGQMVL